MKFQVVCSNKPRSATRTSGKANQWWRREVHHIRCTGPGSSYPYTLCSRHSAEWLVMETSADEANTNDLCSRCRAAYGRIKQYAKTKSLRTEGGV